MLRLRRLEINITGCWETLSTVKNTKNSLVRDSGTGEFVHRTVTCLLVAKVFGMSEYDFDKDAVYKAIM